MGNPLQLPARICLWVTVKLWPLINLAAIACNPLVAKRLPASGVEKVSLRLRRIFGIISWPLLGVRGVGLGVKVIAPDLARSASVWRHVLPIFSAYMWTKWSTDIAAHLFHWDRDRVEARWAAQHERGGQGVLDMISHVQGYYVKTGQVLATKREFVPAAWCKRLARLWDNSRPRPWSNVRRSILKDIEATELAQRVRKLKAAKAKGKREDDNVAAEDVEDLFEAAATANTAGRTSGLLSGWWPSKRSALADAVADADKRVSDSGNPVKAGVISGRSVTGSVGGMSMASWASTSANWLLGPWNTAAQAGKSPTQPLAPTSAVATPADPLVDNLGGLFMVSPSAVEVMAQRAVERLPSNKAQGRKRRGAAKKAAKGKPEIHTQAEKRKYTGDLVDHWFEMIDSVPVASASIAQVHTARLSQELMDLLGHAWTHGPEVVIKVQHHDVQKTMGADLRNMQRIAKFLKPFMPFDISSTVSEMRAVIPKEFDFAREARLMDALRARLTRFSRLVVVPEPLQALCGPGIIVMQRMSGTPLTALLAAAHEGNEGARDAAKRCLLPVLEVYGHMMLIDGLFHADPHPGNMLLQADGRVALLDYGQCKALTAPERRSLCALYMALATGDTRAALEAVKPFGLVLGTLDSNGSTHDTAAANGTPARGKSKASTASGVDLVAAHKMLMIMFDTKWIAESAYQFGTGDLVEGAPVAAFPGPLYLICRAVLILRGLCHSLKADDVSVVSAWKKYASSGLREKEAVAQARAAENAALDRGLQLAGV